MADVEVTILDQTSPVTREGFGKPLVFVPTEEFDFAEVTGTDELPSEVTSDEDGYGMIEAIFAQDPSPEKAVIVGENITEGETATVWQSETTYTTGDAVKPTTENENGHYYEATADGTSGTSEPDWPTNDGATVTDGGVTWEETGYTSISNALDELVVEHDEWYGGLIAERDQTHQEEFASWLSANGKLGTIQPDITVDVSTITTMAGNIASSRIAIYAHDGGTAGEDPYLDAAIMGKIFALDPGRATWKFKTLNNVPIATYKNADVTTLHDGNVNTYVKKLGVNQTSEGYETNGGYIDIQRSKDWLTARIEENVSFLLFNSNKVPYDDPGIAQVVSKLKSTLNNAVDQDVIATDTEGNGIYSIDAPTRDEIDDNEIANRILGDIDFTATIAGAVHSVDITGVLTV